MKLAKNLKSFYENAKAKIVFGIDNIKSMTTEKEVPETPGEEKLPARGRGRPKKYIQDQELILKEEKLPTPEPARPKKYIPVLNKNKLMHFNIDCTCIMCKQGVKKLTEQLTPIITEKCLIELPDDKIIFELTEEIENIMSEKLQAIKNNFPDKKWKECLTEILNISMITYLKSI